MKCDETGPGSRSEIVSYVKAVLEHNVFLDMERNPTATFEKLAGAMVYSILHRLGVEQVEDELIRGWK
jgi:hypothetical protein